MRISDWSSDVCSSDLRGSIVNIASLLSFQGGIRVPSYTAAKSGVAGLTRLLANEWAAKGVNVNAIAPGYIAPNNTAALQAEPTRNRQIPQPLHAAPWGEASALGGPDRKQLGEVRRGRATGGRGGR